MKELNLKVSGMHCCGCENRIVNVLKEVKEIKNVTANHETGSVFIKFKKDYQDIDKIKEMLNNMEFYVEE